MSGARYTCPRHGFAEVHAMNDGFYCMADAPGSRICGKRCGFPMRDENGDVYLNRSALLAGIPSYSVPVVRRKCCEMCGQPIPPADTVRYGSAHRKRCVSCCDAVPADCWSQAKKHGGSLEQAREIAARYRPGRGRRAKAERLEPVPA